MNYNQHLFILMMAITSCLIYIAILGWRKRKLPVANSLFWGMLAAAFYSFGYGFELISSNLEEIRFWLRIEYIGISFGTYFWFILTLQYTNNQRFLRKRVYFALAIVPVLTFVSHNTNEWHYLFYQDMVINYSLGFPLISTINGPFYLLNVCYSYSLFIIGMTLLFKMYRKARPYMKKQVIIMMVGACGPYFVTLLYLSSILPTPIDFSPLGFLISGVFFIWGIYQYNMMKLAPLALQKVFESMEEAVIVVDQDNLIADFNQATVQIFQDLKGQKMIGRSVLDIFLAYPELIETLLKEGDSVHRKVKWESQLGPKYYHISTSLIQDKRQNSIGKMILLDDITEETIAEEKLRIHSKQLAELNAFKDKMFTVIAHDIRDPLSMLVSLMEILKEDMNEEHNEIINEMDTQVQNTFTLVESLLDWFRSQRGGMTYNPVTWNLSKTIQRNLGLLQNQISRKRLHIVSEINDKASVFADKEILDLILRNLLTNAIKFTDFNGSIFLKSEEIDGKVIISIKDTGKGMDPQQTNELQEEQELMPPSTLGTAGERGIGIGLMLCKEFVAINGGEMWFESIPNQGSTFYFSTPVPID